MSSTIDHGRTVTDSVVAGRSRGQTSMQSVDWVVVVASAALTALLGGYRLGAPSLWFDESFSLYTASGDLGHLLSLAVETEASGSLFYLLLGPWLAFGTSEAALRSLPLLFAVLTVPAVYGLAHRLLGRTTARIATPLLALNVMLLTYARDLRGYSLAVLLVTVSSYGLVRALDDDRWRWWALWSLAGALSVYAHLFAVFVLGAQVLTLVIWLRADVRRPRALIATAALAVGCVPMAAFVLANTGEQLAWVPPLGPRSFLNLARELTGVPFARVALVATLGPAVVLACLGLVRLVQQARQRGDARGLLVPAWFFVPVIAAVVISIVVQPVFMPRYLIVILPAYVLLLAVGIASLGHRAAIAVALALVIVPGLPSVVALYDEEGRFQDWRGAMQTIGADFQEGDAIAVAPGHSWAAVDYYADQTLPADAVPAAVYGDEDNARFTGPAIVYDATPSLATIDAERLWLVTPILSAAAETVPFPDTPRDGSTRWSRVDVWEFKGLDLELFERDGG